jgi:pseudouridine-5'-phosphate glycosidase
MNPDVRLSDEVADALADGRPVVALESSPIATSATYPENVEIAGECEDRVRTTGAVPATVAIVDGRVRIGLDNDEMRALAHRNDRTKLSTRDLATCVGSGLSGGTTISATIALAKLVGIRFSAASGLGGVHHGFAARPDVSADLVELARTPMVMVATGFKSILDIEASAEVLETLGVPVMGWQTSSIPRYYVSGGGPAVSARAEGVDDVARFARAHWELLDLRSGILVCQNPRESLNDVDVLIEEGLRQAVDAGVTGPDLTPFVLGHVRKGSNGKAAESSRNMMLDNAALAGQIAVAFAQQRESR